MRTNRDVLGLARSTPLAYCSPVTSLDDQLQRWREAGLIDVDAATRIRDFEADRSRGAPPEPGTSGDDDRPGVLEALIYLGLAIVVVGVAVLVTTIWDDLEAWGRVAVLAVPGALAIVLGYVLRTLREPGMVRGGHLAWLAATALLAGAVIVIGESSDWEPEDSALVASLAAAIIALALWAVSASHPQAVGVVAAATFVASMVGTRIDDNGPTAVGLLCVAFGAAGVVLAEARYFRPHSTAAGSSAALVAFGALFLMFDTAWGEALSFAVAGALVAASILRGVMLYMLLGVALAFVGLIQVIAERVGDPALASAALIAVGVVLIGVVLVLMKVRPWRMARPDA